MDARDEIDARQRGLGKLDFESEVIEEATALDPEAALQPRRGRGIGEAKAPIESLLLEEHKTTASSRPPARSRFWPEAPCRD